MVFVTEGRRSRRAQRRDPRRARLASEAIKSDSGCHLFSVRISIQ
jgi:hypothetical protein